MIQKIFRRQIFIPIAALLILAIFNLIADPSFYKITLGYNSAGNPVLSGYLITILDYGSELAILAIGMTLVTAASGGQDISVGAAIAMFFLFHFLTPTVLAVLFASVAGIMVFISFDELLPMAERWGHHHISIMGIIAGMLLMAIVLI